MTDCTNRLGYGTPREVAAMLDAVAVSVREEPLEQWQDPSLRAATEGLRDLLAERLRS